MSTVDSTVGRVPITSAPGDSSSGEDGGGGVPGAREGTPVGNPFGVRRRPGRWSAGGRTVDAARDGISALYASHWASMVRLAWLLVRDQSVAEEIAADAFVAVYRRWHTLTDEAKAPAYLRRSVVNGCRSAQRHARVVREDLIREAGTVTALGRLGMPSAEAEVARQTERQDVMIALTHLPRRQREVLVLRYYTGLSELEIADALGVSAGSVKAHAHRGINTLRDRLAAATGDEELA